MKARILSLALALTLPMIGATLPAYAMEEEAFKAALWPPSPTNPHQVVAQLEQLIESGNLTPDQHARALYQIGVNYGTTAHDRTKAIETYETFLNLFPDHALAERAASNRDYANTQLGYIRKRLATGPIEAADLMANGQWADVAGHLGTPGFLINETDLRGLYYAGWFCEPGMLPIGSENTEQKLVSPCPEPRDPITIPALKILY